MKQTLTVLIILALLGTLYLVFPATRYNTDGFRVLPSLHQVKLISPDTRQYLPLDWRSGYRQPAYFYQNVPKHLLFPLYAGITYRLARLTGYHGNGIKPLQIANTISAILTLTLFALLIQAYFHHHLLTITATLGLGLTTAFSAMATNIAEVVPALPWLLCALLFIKKEKYILAGICLGISTAFYLFTLLVALGLLLTTLLRRQCRNALYLVITTIITTALIYLLILLGAGYTDLRTIVHLITFMPEQGTYGGFKLSNLLAVNLGFINSVIPVLPEHFSGISALIRSGDKLLLFLPFLTLAGATAILLILILAGSRAGQQQELLTGLGVFLAALFGSLLWDPYHQKIWLYCNIALFTILPSLVFRSTHLRQFALLLILIIAPVNIYRIIQHARPNPQWQSAQTIAAIVTTRDPTATNSIILGAWEPEFDYLQVFLPDSALIPLPDLILHTGRNPNRFYATIDRTIQTVFTHGGNIYLVNHLNRPKTELERFYRHRLRSPFFLDWLETLRPAAEEIWHNPATRTTLYHLTISLHDLPTINLHDFARFNRLNHHSRQPALYY